MDHPPEDRGIPDSSGAARDEVISGPEVEQQSSKTPNADSGFGPLSPIDSDDSVTVTRSSKLNARANKSSSISEKGASTDSERSSVAEPLSERKASDNVTDPDGEDSEITVVSRKPPHSVNGNPASSQQLGELLLGKQLGTFRLDHFLGSGGMGAVFQATDIQLHRQVAVKVLKNTDGDPDAIRRFRTEAQSAARLDHENIARVYHVGQDQGWNYIVLELVAGKTLRQLVAQDGPLSFDVALDFFQQLSAALQHAHHRQIIHRDIKPSNVLITPDQKVKLVDMGLARIVSSERQADETEDGMTLGTFDYIAPEQARDPKSADQQSDLYSLGCTLFFALTGRPPFAGGNAIEKILNHSSAARPNVCDFRSDLPPAANLLIARLMAPNKVDRIASADEFGMALAYLRRPRVTRPRELDNQPVGFRIPILFGVAAVVIFVAASLIDDPPIDSAVVFPEIPGTVLATERTTDFTEGTQPSDASKPMERSPNGPTPPFLNPISDEKEATPETQDPSFDLTLQPWRQDAEASSFNTTSSYMDDWKPSWWLKTWNGGTERNDALFAEGEPVGVLAPTSSAKSNVEVDQAKPPMPKNIAGGTEDEAIAQTTTIQVRPQDARNAVSPLISPRPNTVVYNSLNEAIGSLDRLFNVHTIELCFNEELECQPIEIDSTVLRIIKAGDGFRPTLRFRSDERRNVRSLITISSGSIDVSGIDWIVDGSTRNESSLFDFPKLTQLNVTDCTFTLASQRSGETAWQWIDANTSQLVSSVRQSQAMVTVADCAIRGNARLLRLENFGPVGINLENVWMVSPSSIFSFGSVPTETMEPSVEIDIERCSLISGKGLAVCEAFGERKHGQLLVHSKASLLAVDKSHALFNHNGQVQWKPGLVPLYFDGSKNRLIGNTIWNIQSEADFLNRSYGLSQAKKQSWFKQKEMREPRADLSSDSDLANDGGLREFGAYSVAGITSMASQADWAFMPSTVSERSEDGDAVGADSAKLPVFPSQ